MNGRSTSPLANIALHHSSKNEQSALAILLAMLVVFVQGSPDAADPALCAVTSARESRLYCSGVDCCCTQSSLASHCHVVQECSNLVSGEYAGNRALDCARTLGLAPLTGLPFSSHSPMRMCARVSSSHSGSVCAALSLLPDRRLLLCPAVAVAVAALRKMHALGCWRW